jgi:hypothetical protein
LPAFRISRAAAAAGLGPAAGFRLQRARPQLAVGTLLELPGNWGIVLSVAVVLAGELGGLHERTA